MSAVPKVPAPPSAYGSDARVQKSRARQRARQQRRPPPSQNTDAKATIYIRQRPSILKGLLIPDSRNQFDIAYGDGTTMGYAAEPKGLLSFLRRMLRITRFSIHFFNAQQKEIFITKFSMRYFFLRQADVFTSSGRHLGNIRSRFSFFPISKSIITDTSNNMVAEHNIRNEGKFFHWGFDFEFKNAQGQSVATIEHNYYSRNLFQEDDDLFVLKFQPHHGLNDEHKLLLLAAVFYIDVKHFDHYRTRTPGRYGFRGLP